MQSPRMVSLSSGDLACREFGNPKGHPLFFFHGWPGSSAQAWLLHAAAERHGFRGFAFDRPGIGNSPIAKRRLLDWPGQICEFAETNGFDRFAILGISGGGPYALACAAECPGKISAATVVCGAPPIAELSGIGGLHPIYQSLLRVFRRYPAWVRRFFALNRPLMMWPDALRFLQPLRIILPRADAQAIEDPENFASVFGCQRDAFQDVDGLYADAELYAEPWGFAPEAIQIPVQFWHGRDDSNFHYSLAVALASRVPQGRLELVENEGHFSLPINQADAIVAALAKSAKLNV
jgi:pimeloyl-ACP methyl ester carboxylesterase